MENIPLNSIKRKKYRIKWLEAVGNNNFDKSYVDSIFTECIIDSVMLINRSKMLKLPPSEEARIQKLMESERADELMEVENMWSDEESPVNSKEKSCKFVCEANDKQNSDSNIEPDSHGLPDSKIVPKTNDVHESTCCVGDYKEQEKNAQIDSDKQSTNFSDSDFVPDSDVPDSDIPDSDIPDSDIPDSKIYTKPKVMFSSPRTRLLKKTLNKVLDIDDAKPKEILSSPSRNIMQLKPDKNIVPESSCTVDDSSNSSSDELSNSTIKLPLSKSNKLTGKIKVYDQVHSCFYCDKIVNKMSRHLEICHHQEMDVAKVLAMPKKSTFRREAFIELTRLGDYHYNCDVLYKRSGELILIRRPSTVEKETKTYSDYLPCPHCLGFMLKKHMWSHIKYKCKVAKRGKSAQNTENNRKSNFLDLSKALVAHTFPKEVSESFYCNIISTLKKHDGVKEICGEDPLIVRFGMLLFEKFNVTKNDNIRQSMRRLGRLVLEFRKSSSKFVQASLLDCLDPKNYDIVIQAVKNLCMLELTPTDRPTLKIPSLALKIGHALRKCAALQRGSYLREGNINGDRMMTSFLSLMEIEWENRVSSAALNTIRRAKLTKQDLLPLTSDLKKLNDYLDKSIENDITELIEDPSNPTIWLRLSKLALSRIMIFNKKRSGEIAKMKITNYTERRNWEGENSEEIKSTLSDLEKRLMQSMTLVYIIGKAERNVPVLLTKNTKEAIDVLLLYRKHISLIQTNNENMFPKFNSHLGHLVGYEVLKQVCSQVGLERPDLITSTKMRKYIATVTQVLDLTENESDWLARHLGHNIRVHREYYRLQESAVELTKVSRLLLAVDSGKISDYSGRKLDDIQVEGNYF